MNIYKVIDSYFCILLELINKMCIFNKMKLNMSTLDSLDQTLIHKFLNYRLQSIKM